MARLPRAERRYTATSAFPGVEKRRVVRGIPQDIVDALERVGACSGHAEMTAGYDYDSVATGIDTEGYKLVAFELMEQAGVTVWVNTLLTGAITDGSTVNGVITESRSGIRRRGIRSPMAGHTESLTVRSASRVLTISWRRA